MPEGGRRGDNMASNPAKWTDIDERKLDALKFSRIAMADTAMGGVLCLPSKR